MRGLGDLERNRRELRDARLLANWFLKRAGSYDTAELTAAARRILELPDQPAATFPLQTAAERRFGTADQPAATETGPLGVGEIAEMLTGLPFGAEQAPQGAPLVCSRCRKRLLSSPEKGYTMCGFCGI